MKRTTVILAMAGLTLAAAVIINTVQPQYDVSIQTQDSGLKSLKVNKVEFLENGEFRINQVTLKKPDGTIYLGSKSGSSEFDGTKQELTKTYPWGIVKVRYTASRNRLALTILAVNKSDTETIQGILFEPLSLRFPAKVLEYDGNIPLLSHNVGDVAFMKVSWGSGSVGVVSEDIDKPLMVGFPWALDRPRNTAFPLSIHTDRVNNYPDSYPTLTRPIPPRGQDEFHVSLRFGKADATETDLAADVSKKFGETYPSELKWDDRRAIGAIFLATASSSWRTNPQGWFGDEHLDVTTPAGKAQFRERLLALADSAVTIMKGMNAQGAITRDVEGEHFSSAISYIGDPRRVVDMAPDFNEVADEYFARIRNSGLRVGVTVRPQELTFSSDGKTPIQKPLDDPTQLLIDKIAYAKKRWNATLIYIDSNASFTNSMPLDAGVIQKVAEAFPDILLVPQNSTMRYHAYSAPMLELKRGALGTSDEARSTYPKAFSVIYTADGPLDLYQKNLARSVKQGDTLMYRTWYADPQNEKVKALLQH